MAKNNNLVSVEKALNDAIEGIKRLDTEVISISEALGRVLADDLASRTTQPPLAVSAMDGYAIRAEDVLVIPAALLQIGESSAGSGFNGTINPGETVRIFTGAPVPDGADAIVIQENTTIKRNKVFINHLPKVGDFIRQKGLDFKANETLLSSGTKLNSRHIALISAMNIPWIRVTRKPHIAILSSGNELVMPGEPIKIGHIISSNSLGLSAFISSLGGTSANLGIAQDTSDSIQGLVSNLSGADMLVTIGGASVGDYDLIKSVLHNKGLKLRFSKVAMRPGKPLIFGEIKSKPMLGVPGNPVSAGVTAVLFLKPMMDRMLGVKSQLTPYETAILSVELPKNDYRQDYLRSRLKRGKGGEIIVTPFNKQDSSMLAIFAHADCLIVRKPLEKRAKPGDRVPIIRLDPTS
ncbi:MAG: gephyrin-like molybdotransferase Glp [Pseudomonadota bacterium]|nr:gephyrin-like molybdotransferase Glp [Pseudomonadota bacterium]